MSLRNSQAQELIQLAIGRGWLELSQANWLWQQAQVHELTLLQALKNSKLLTPEQLLELSTELTTELRTAANAPVKARIIDSTSSGQLPALGERVDQYEILESLGVGGMGAVFKARDSRRKYALKFLLDKSERATQRFIREAQTLAKVDKHPNIVRVFQVGTWQNSPYLVMEYIQGSDLNSMLKENSEPPDNDEITRILEKLAKALSALHQRQLIHRDLKPGNVLIRDSDQEVLLVDFGLVKDENAESLTMSHELTGTPNFMAPEQISGEKQKLGTWTDIWAFGVLGYFLATNQYPFRGKSNSELCAQIMMQPASDPRKINSALNANLATLILNCLGKEPQSRYASGAELVQEFQNIRSGLRVSKSQSWIGQSIHRLGFNRALIVAILIAVIVLVIAVQLWSRHLQHQKKQMAQQRLILTLEKQSKKADVVLAQELLNHYFRLKYPSFPNAQFRHSSQDRQSSLIRPLQALTDGPLKLKTLPANLRPITLQLICLLSLQNNQVPGDRSVKASDKNMVKAHSTSRLALKLQLTEIDNWLRRWPAAIQAGQLTDLKSPWLGTRSQSLLDSLQQLQQPRSRIEDSVYELKQLTDNQSILHAIQLHAHCKRYLTCLINNDRVSSSRLAQKLAKACRTEAGLRGHLKTWLQSDFDRRHRELSTTKLSTALEINYRCHQKYLDIPVLKISAKQSVQVAKVFEQQNKVLLFALHYYMAQSQDPQVELPKSLRSNLFLVSNRDYLFAKQRRDFRRVFNLLVFMADALQLGYLSIYNDDNNLSAVIQSIPVDSQSLDSALGIELKLLKGITALYAGDGKFQRDLSTCCRYLEELLRKPDLPKQYRAVAVRRLYRYYSSIDNAEYREKLKKHVESHLKLELQAFDIKPYAYIVHYYDYHADRKLLTVPNRHRILSQLYSVTMHCRNISVTAMGYDAKMKTRYKRFSTEKFKDTLREQKRYLWRLWADQEKHKEIVRAYRQSIELWTPQELARVASTLGTAFIKTNQRHEAEILYELVKSSEARGVKRLKERLEQSK